jgi:hypothetical protein
MTTELEKDLSPQRHKELNVSLGPLFTAGAILLVYGLLRRKKIAVGAGLGAIWLDQRSEFGRSLKRRIRARSSPMVEEALSRTKIAAR